MKRLHGVTAALAAFLWCAVSVLASPGFGVGATFPYPVYASWADAYQKATGIGVNYQSIGSGGGIAQIKAGTATFGASDVPLPADELARLGLIQFPTVIGGVVPVVNLPGIAPGRLVLSGPVLADIYRGKLRRWNDPRIAALNPGVPLPDMVIAPVTRSDKSGTTYNFTAYLARFYPRWQQEIGVAAAVNWPLGIGVKGNEGVANHITRTYGSIGYVEYTYVKQNRLTFARMRNRAGRTVSPSAKSFAAAAANVDWHDVGTPGFGVDLLDRSDPQAWPVVAATYILLYRKSAGSSETRSVLDFFSWCFRHGDDIAARLDFVPLTPDAKRKILNIIK